MTTLETDRIVNKVRRKAKHLHWKYGASYEQIAKALKVKTRYIYRCAYLDGWRYKGREFSHKYLLSEWDLEGETEAAEYYQQIKDQPYPLYKVAKAFGCDVFEISRLLNSNGVLLNKIQCEWQKYVTNTVVAKLSKNPLSLKDVVAFSKKLKLAKHGIKLAFKKNRTSFKTMCYRPTKEDLALVEKLYAEGWTPKQMIEEGKTKIRNWCTIYNHLREQGYGTHRHYKKQRELRKIIAENPYESENWRAFTILTRRLTEVTYKKYKDEIDPFEERGDAYHLDHKISVHKAFCLGWSPEEAACGNNLQMLPALENRSKSIN